MKQPCVLVACEESGRVTEALRNVGVIAFSADILPTSGNHPEWHIQGDVLPILNGDCDITVQTGKSYHFVGRWDAIIAFPPCIYLTVAGNRYFDRDRYGVRAEERWERRKEGAEFFMRFVNADCDCIAIENPVGYMNSHYRKPDQIIQPYYFGHPVSKKTCLWLKNLPLLQWTNPVEYEKIHSKGRTGGDSGPSWYVKDENGKILSWKDPRTAKARSKTYPGVAEAMAKQWGMYLFERVNQ